MAHQDRHPDDPMQDVAYLGHIELGTPKMEESLRFFTELMGLTEVARDGRSVYLRCWGDFDRTTVKLTESDSAGLLHTGWRANGPHALERRVAALEASGRGLGWIEGDVGHGAAYRFTDPDDHLMEIYWDAEMYESSDEDRSNYKNTPQRLPNRGAMVRRLDHLHVLCNDVPRNRGFMADMLGFKLRENVVLDNGTEISSWISVTPLVHDIAYSLDGAVGAKGRLHHAGFLVENREDILRTADIFADYGVFIESGPSKHKISHQFFLYVYEPGGNRIEVVTGGYLIFQPDWKPVTWSEADRRDGQAWGLKLPPSFHSYGTPLIEDASELRDIPVVGLT
jgi:catechol 2,3-dioxygenase